MLASLINGILQIIELLLHDALLILAAILIGTFCVLALIGICPALGRRKLFDIAGLLFFEAATYALLKYCSFLHGPAWLMPIVLTLVAMIWFLLVLGKWGFHPRS